MLSNNIVKLSVACFLLLGVALIFVPGAEAVWEQMDDYPSDLEVNRGASISYDSESDRAIFFEDSGQNVGDDVFSYDFNADNWTQMDDYPSGLTVNHGGFGVYDSESDRIIFFENKDSYAGNDVFAYDFNNDEWTQMYDYPAGLTINNGALVTYNSESDRIIFFESRDSSVGNDVYAYDFNVDDWTQMDDYPSNLKINRGASISYDSGSDIILVFENSDSSAGNDVFAYDFKDDDWDQMSDYPSSLKVNHGGFGVYASGMDRVLYFENSDSSAGDDVFAYDSDGDEWKQMDDHPLNLTINNGALVTYDSESSKTLFFENKDSNAGNDVFANYENNIPELVNYSITPNPASYIDEVYFYSNFSDSDGFITKYYWSSSRDGFLSSSRNFSTDSLSIGNHLILVRAKDNQGSWSNNYTVSLLSIDNRLPELVNYSVSPNPASYNDRVYFYSNFSDSEGYIVQYSWSSSIDGLLSSNSNFSTDDLSVGNHIIVVRAKDSYGDWSENTTIELEIEDSYSPPVVNWIQINPNPGYYSDNILFTSDFSLCDDCYATGFEWRSDIDGVLESQNSMFDYVGLTVGMHNFSFKVRDNTGAWSDTYNETLVVMQDEDYFIPSITWINIDSNPSYEGEMVFLEAILSVCDVTDCFITEYEWISDIDGLFETQSSDVYRVGFSLGEHNISLRVKDHRDAWSDYYNTTLSVIEDNPIIYGCTDSSADNFYPDATNDDGSCVFTVYGCTNYDASNYNPNATVEDGSCSFGVLGCTSNYANNYNSEATSDDGSCEFDELENFTHTKLIDLYKLDASNEPYLHKSKGDSLAVEYFSSYYSTSEYTRNKGDWVYLPQWYIPMQYLQSSNESEQGITDLRLSKISVKLWWMEELNDEDYDAALDFKFTVLQNEDIIYQMYYLENLECDEDQEASSDNPCLLTLDLVLPYVVSFSEDDILSLDIQMRSFQVIKILYGSEERDSGMSLYGIANIDDNDLIPEGGDMFYLPPEGQELIPKNLSVTYGIAVNSDIHQGIETLANLSGVTLCLETGGEIDSYLANYFGQRGLDYIPLDSDEQSGTGESFFVGGYCGAWVAKSDTLKMFDESYDSSFQREILMEKISINYTDEFSTRINAQYTNTAGLFKSDRQPVNVGTWDYFSTVNDTITINYAEFWWQNLENGDDTCIWKFSIYKNGFSVSEYSAYCSSDGTMLLPEIYIINSSFAVSEGDHIQIEITYEGWEDIQFYYGSELHPSGFSISGLIETEVTIEEELGEDDMIDEALDDGSETINTPTEEVSLPFELNVFTMGLMAAAAGLVAAAFAEAGARQSVTKIIDELQSLVDAGVTDSDLNKSIEELQNLDGFRYFSGDRSNALELLNNYNEVQGQALGAMQQLDELESVVAELEAAGVSSPELDAEISEIQSMLEAQLEGDTSEDYSKSLFEQFRQNKGGD